MKDLVYIKKNGVFLGELNIISNDNTNEVDPVFVSMTDSVFDDLNVTNTSMTKTTVNQLVLSTVADGGDVNDEELTYLKTITNVTSGYSIDLYIFRGNFIVIPTIDNDNPDSLVYFTARNFKGATGKPITSLFGRNEDNYMVYEAKAGLTLNPDIKMLNGFNIIGLDFSDGVDLYINSTDDYARISTPRFKPLIFLDIGTCEDVFERVDDIRVNSIKRSAVREYKIHNQKAIATNRILIPLLF